MAFLCELLLQKTAYSPTSANQIFTVLRWLVLISFVTFFGNFYLICSESVTGDLETIPKGFDNQDLLQVLYFDYAALPNEKNTAERAGIFDGTFFTASGRYQNR